MAKDLEIVTRVTLPAVATILVAAVDWGSVAAAETKRVAITTIVEVPQLIEVRDGVLVGLAEAGFVEGENLAVDYQNAQGNMGTASQIARKFVGDRPDVIVPITTPSSQTVVAAAEGLVPIVFTAVTDPLGAKLVTSLEQPGGNVTGLSDLAPVEAQMDLIDETLPALERLGVVYNPGLDNSVAYVDLLKANAAAFGWQIVEAAAPTSNDVVGAVRSLIGRADALYVPNDSTVNLQLEAAVIVAQEADLPLFAGETRAVERGAIASLGFDYHRVGLETAKLVALVLNGADPGTLDVLVYKDAFNDFNLHVNPASAADMGVVVPAAVIERADVVH